MAPLQAALVRDGTRGGDAAQVSAAPDANGPANDRNDENINGVVSHLSAVLEAMREESANDAKNQPVGDEELLVEHALVIGSSKVDIDVGRLREELRSEKEEKDLLRRKAASLRDALRKAKDDLHIVGPAFATKTAHAKELEETIARMLKLKCKDDEQFRLQAEEAEKLLIYWSRKSKILASRKSGLERDLAGAAREREAARVERERILDELNGLKSKSCAQKEELEGRVRELEADVERVTSDANSAQARARKEAEILRGENADAQRQNILLEDEVAALRKQVEDLTSEKQKALEGIKMVVARHDADQKIIRLGDEVKSELEGQVSVLSNDLRSSEERAAEMQLQLESMTEERDSAIELTRNTQQLMSRAQNDLSSMTAERDRAITEKEKANIRVRELGGERDIALSEIERLRKNLDNAKAAAADLRGKVMDLEGNAARNKSANENLNGKNVKLEALNNELIEERNRALKDLGDMTSNYRLSQDNFSAANASVDRLELRVRAMQEDVSSLVQEKSKVQTELESAMKENKELKLKLGTASDELRAFEADMKIANNREQEVTSEAAAIAQQRDELLSQVSLLGEKLTKLSADTNDSKARAMKQIEQLSAQNIDLLSNSKALQDQLALLQSTIQELTFDKENMQRQMKLLAEQQAAKQQLTDDLQTRLDSVLAERDHLLHELQKSQSFAAELSKERAESASNKAAMERAVAREQEVKRKNLAMEKEMQFVAKEADKFVTMKTAELQEDLSRSLAKQKSAELEAERCKVSLEEAKAYSVQQREDLMGEMKRLETKFILLTKERDDLQARATKQIEELERLLRLRKGVNFDVECKACGAPLHALFRTPERKRHKGSVWERLHKTGTYASNAHHLSGVISAESPSGDLSVASLPKASPVTPSTPSTPGINTHKPRHATPRDLVETFQ